MRNMIHNDIYGPPYILNFKESLEESDKLVNIHKQVNKKLEEIKLYDLSPSANSEANDKIIKLKNEIAYLKDLIKFQNPFIYIRYEALAFVGTYEYMETLEDLFIHCGNMGSICNKRMHMINLALKEYFGLNLFDENQFVRNSLLIDLLGENSPIFSLSQDINFMCKWQGSEFFSIDGTPSKWQNYTASNKTGLGLILSDLNLAAAF